MVTGMTRTGYYLAYYELHEIPWELELAEGQRIRWMDDETGEVCELSHGPFYIPGMVLPEIRTRAGGATIEAVNDSRKLEGGTYFAVQLAVSMTAIGKPVTEPKLPVLTQRADDLAASVGLALDQRLPLKKITGFVKHIGEDGKPYGFLAVWQASTGAKSVVSERSLGAVKGALEGVRNEAVAQKTLLALRWYEQSKAAAYGADRLLSLWIALEAMMPTVENHVQLVHAVAKELSNPQYGLDLAEGEVIRALGLEQMRKQRIQVVHDGWRPVPWPVDINAGERDWPQILNDVVGEMLRMRLGIPPTGLLYKHAHEATSDIPWMRLEE